MKQIKIFIAVILAAGLITGFSAFKKSHHKVAENMYFRYLEADNDEGDFETAASWDYLGTSDPGTDCSSGSDACIVVLPNGTNQLDPDDDPEDIESGFASILAGINGGTYSDATDFVENNTVHSKP